MQRTKRTAHLDATNKLVFENASGVTTKQKAPKHVGRIVNGVAMKQHEWDNYRLMCIRYPNNRIFVFRLDGRIQFSIVEKDW